MLFCKHVSCLLAVKDIGPTRAALLIQTAAHNGGVKPEMMSQLKEAIHRLPGH